MIILFLFMYDAAMYSRINVITMRHLLTLACMLMGCFLTLQGHAADDDIDFIIPKIEPITSRAPNRPYRIAGKLYEPLNADVPFRQRGQSSWYGIPFHGRKTASGEIFNMNEMTAAHPTLPIPSYVRVSRVGTDRTVIVRINDRGPFHGSRVIDLSYAAAKKLGITHKGTAEVDIERLTFDDIRVGKWRKNNEPGQEVAPSIETPTTTAANDHDVLSAWIQMTLPSPSETTQVADAADTLTANTALTNEQNLMPDGDQKKPSSACWVQLAAFEQATDADALHQRLQPALGDLASSLTIHQDGTWNRLRLGPYSEMAEANLIAKRAKDLLQLDSLFVQCS